MGICSAKQTDPNLNSEFADPGGYKLRKKYTVSENLIGKGHYAFVYKGTENASGKPVAIKVIQKAKSSIERLFIEIDIMRKLGSHPNLVELYDVYDDSESNELSLVMEYLDGGELFEYLEQNGNYAEKDAAKLAYHIAQGLKYLHDRNIVHRDLKPENLLLKEDAVYSEVKLADFGLAKILKKDTKLLDTICGTWAYAAPEVKQQEISGKSGYTAKVDNWSFGVIVFVLISGYHPFDPSGVTSDEDMQEAINACKFDYDDPIWIPVSKEGKDLISACVKLDPSSRLSTEEILEHPWFKKMLGDELTLDKDHHTRSHSLEKLKETNQKRKQFKADVNTDMVGVNVKS